MLFDSQRSMLMSLRGCIASKEFQTPYARQGQVPFHELESRDLRGGTTSHQVKSKPGVVNLEEVEDETPQMPEIYYPTPVRNNGATAPLTHGL